MEPTEEQYLIVNAPETLELLISSRYDRERGDWYILFEPWEEGMRIFYGDRTLSISQVSEFTEALKLTAKEFLKKCDRQAEFDSNNLFNVIRDFVNN